MDAPLEDSLPVDLVAVDLVAVDLVVVDLGKMTKKITRIERNV